MFRLTKDEYEDMARSKNFTSRIWTIGNKGGRTSLLYVFSEQGIYMFVIIDKNKAKFL